MKYPAIYIIRATFIFTYLLAFSLSSCNNTGNKDNETLADTVVVSVTTLDSTQEMSSNGAIKSGAWLENLKNLRSAILNNDIKAIQRYFKFPLNVEETSIWLPIHPTDEELEKWKSNAQDSLSFNQKDFQQFYSRIFTKELKMGLTQIKTEKLSANETLSTKEFTNVAEPFQLYVECNEQLGSVSFNIAFSGATEGDGNEGGEGEYNLIYIFKIVGDQLEFEKMIIAG